MKKTFHAAAKLICLYMLCAGRTAFSAADSQPAKSGEPPVNAWVALGSKPMKQWSSIWYLPATGEFFHWGRPTPNRWWSFTRHYDVDTLKLSDEEPAWRESFPPEKEAEWSKGLWPDWVSPKNVKNPKWKVIRGPLEGNENPGFVMSFVETDGVQRPNRCPVFHEATWDSKRNKLFFFVGGKTFTYDPVKRVWEHLKTPTPVGCLCLQWHTLCYDPVGDKVVLFGGGAAMTPWGGAKTHVYDFEKNEWIRPAIKGGVEPELRCTARLVYDSKNKLMVMFGGNAMDRTLNDTWVLDPANMAWEERKPEACPPPTEYYAACYLEPAGQIFMCRARRGSSRNHNLRDGDVWAYDAAANVWTPIKGVLPLDGETSWVSCDYDPKANAIVLAAPLVGTWLYKPDPKTWEDTEPKRRKGKPGQEAYFYGGLTHGIRNATPPDRAATAKWLADLPDNKVVVPDYTEWIPHKTWGSAAIDTDKGVVLYLGGGHSGYKGNEMLQYDVGANRWQMDSPPCMMPFEWEHGAAIYGWRYRLRPSDQHTYGTWYAYDPVSKLVVYCARACGPHHGQTVLTDDDPAKAFVYDKNKHGNWTWVYDPNTLKWFKPVWGMPTGLHDFTLALIATPHGIFAKNGGLLYRIEVLRTGRADEVELKWHKLNGAGIGGIPKGYHWEFQPIVYDSKRDRLIYVAGPKDYKKDTRPLMLFEWPMATGGPWKKMETSGYGQMTREFVYDVENDALLGLGQQRIFVMHCSDNVWKELDMAMPRAIWDSYGTECAMVYDPVHKVCAFLIKAKKVLHLFRYNPKTAKYVETNVAPTS